jgi:hypothetical protein
MRRLLVSALFLSLIAIATTIQSTTSVSAAPSTPTFNKDVLPILQKNCQECHRPGAIAPMSFVTYKDARPYARAIAKAVVTKSMPPWFADPTVGHFKNAKVLSDAEIATIAEWAETGALEGAEKDKPAPIDFGDGWTIGKPDIVVTTPNDIDIPATGIIDQANLLVHAHFDKDIWVKAAEVKPGNPRVVHHMKAWIRPPNSAWMKDAPEGVMYNPPRGAQGFDGAGPQTIALSATGYRPAQDILAKYNPGVEGQEFTTGHAAKFIAAGSDIVFEIHYTATGKPEKDRSSVGIILANGPPQQRHLTTTAISVRAFEIPAGDPNYRNQGGNRGQRAGEARVGAAAHALPRERLRAEGHLSIRRGSHRSPRAELQVRLAGGVRARGAARSAQGHEIEDRLPLRQFHGQQIQSRSHEKCPVRSAKLG